VFDQFGKNMNKIKYLILGIVSMCFVTSVQSQTFTNPLLPSGADPWSIYKDGYYYYMHTAHNKLVLWKTKDLADLAHSEKKTIFVPPAGTAYSKELWAPEIHFLDNKWYVYFAADNGKNETHRMYVLENSSADPMSGAWEFKGKIADKTDRWAIDGSVFYHKNKLYMIWSGWEGDENGKQEIFIAKMKTPYTLKGKRYKISSPQLDWELHGDLNDPDNPPHVSVNEGPQILKRGDRTFLIYSASGCWTDFYALGILDLKGKNIMKSSSWIKGKQPVFKQSPENGVYAPGHNSFFKSPDGTEDWILYHANSKPGQGCGGFRSPRAQKFTWNTDGAPNFGIPVKAGEKQVNPSESN
jgi:GH43 family beta-xylosidase